MTMNKPINTQYSINEACNSFMHWSYSNRLVCGLSAFILLAGCSSSNTPNYYSLSPQVAPLVQANQVRVIEVLPVGLADRLNRIPLVIQTPRGESLVLNEDRWTSTLSAELRDGLSAGLQQKLGAFDRYNSGMTGGKAAYRIAVDFARFDFVDSQATAVSKKADARADQIAVVVAWTLKLDDPHRPLSAPKNAKDIPTDHQLNCRMQWTQQIATSNPKLLDVVDSSRQSLNQVVEGIASSVIAFERNSKPSVKNGTCT